MKKNVRKTKIKSPNDSNKIKILKSKFIEFYYCYTHILCINHLLFSLSFIEKVYSNQMSYA